MARSGLFVAPVPGTPPVGTSATDGRLALAGLIGATPQLVQGGAVSQSSSNMQITVAQAVWELPDSTNAAAAFLSPTDSQVVTPAAGPGTGSRVDSVLVKQNNFENGDADSRANVYLKAGAASGTPSAPALDPGSYRYANVLVPTNASTAAACTVTVFSPTTFAAPNLLCPTKALLDLVTGRPSQLATVNADSSSNNGVYQWNGTAWARFVTNGNYAEFTTSVINLGNGVVGNVGTITIDATNSNDTAFASGGGSGAITIVPTGAYLIQVMLPLGAGATARTESDITIGGVVQGRGVAPAGEDAIAYSALVRTTTASTVLTFGMLQQTGASRSVSGRIRLLKIG